MLGLALACTVLFSLVAVSRWRQGIYLAILTAFIQDPLRKLAPGEPIYFNLLCGVVFVAASVGALGAGVRLAPNAMAGWRRYLAAPFGIYAIWILFQAGHSLVSFGQPLIPALGLVNYIAPFFALVVTYQFFVRGGTVSIATVMQLYLILATVAVFTVFLQAKGIKLPIFGEVGEGIHISEMGGILQANSGIFRGSEIAAWHAGTAICVAILLTTSRKFGLISVGRCAILIVALAAIGALTGRRKFLVMVAIFVLSYIALIFLYQRRRRAFAIAALLSGLGAYLIGEAFLGDTFTTLRPGTGDYGDYVLRMSSVFGAVPARFVQLGMAPISWAYDSFGLLGAGLGVGTQGIGQLSPVVAQSAGAAEGGLGKITLELGIPGLIIAAFLGLAMVRHIGRILRYVARTSEPLTRLGCGMVAILLANAASFSVATQTYGDIFVLMFLGLLLGAVMALPVLANLRARAREQAWRQQVGAPLDAAPAPVAP